MADNQTQNNTDDVESMFRDFICDSVDKFSKEWNNKLSENLETQFKSIKTVILGLKNELKTDIQKLEISLVSKVNEATKAAAAAKTKADTNAVEITELTTKMTMLQTEMRCMRKENQDLKIQINNVDCYSRRDNLVFYGIDECDNESIEQCIVSLRNFLKNTLKLPEGKVDCIPFVRCHRMGSRPGKRPIIARFKEYADRMLIWDNMDKIPRDKHIFITENYPKDVSANRKKLLPIFHRARNTVGKRQVSLKNDVLKVSGDVFTVNNINCLPGELNPRCFTRKSGYDTLVFGGSLSEFECLSNWGKFPVSYKGITYPTLEHGFMHLKCMANDAINSAQAVLDSSEPYLVKQIGDKIAIKKDVWTQKKSEEVMTALVSAKFTSGSDMATELLQTGNKYLAETGKNKIYACGLSMTHPDVLKRDSHTGKNRLGHMLMKQRTKLRNK